MFALRFDMFLWLVEISGARSGCDISRRTFLQKAFYRINIRLKSGILLIEYIYMDSCCIFQV